MKKIICSFIFILVVVTLSFSAQIKQWIHPEKVVGKNINITIIQSDGYNRSAYAHSTAMLNLMVISLRGKTMDTLMVKNYPTFRLKNLSAFSKNFNETVYVPGVADSREQIVFIYNIVYNSGNSVLTLPGARYIGKGETNDSLLIRI